MQVEEMRELIKELERQIVILQKTRSQLIGLIQQTEREKKNPEGLNDFLNILRLKVQKVTAKSIDDSSWASQRFAWGEIFIAELEQFRDELIWRISRDKTQSKARKQAGQVLKKLKSLLAGCEHPLRMAKYEPKWEYRRSLVANLKKIFWR